ncbi:RICIN domain-containing protein [Mucilaginibacter sp. UR6-11]|uniref:RICIN domain-containing protein n=1 Tax=Mucilaginibacter sp. UR6-11 TaxID=1435644 RepID=UPI001E4DECB8|nr:RICIN domain-containing protein [Mucilaginibacter sp. UR6-11]MCC8423464.1 RICIN domain-containing protein [Mucilaginibacter sp. UR6-11]
MKKILLFIAFVSFTVFVAAQDIRGNYAIKNVQTGMLLRVKDAGSKNGTPLVAYYPENWKCMTWNFKKTDANTYQLQNLLTHKTFQPVKPAGADVPFDEQPLVPGDTRQQYEFILVKKATYLIKLKGTELYVTPADSQGALNSAIILAAKKNTPDQLWTIYEQAPTM